MWMYIAAGSTSDPGDAASTIPIVVAGIALLGVLVTQIVTLVISQRQGSRGQRQWVLEKRYEAYAGVMDAATGLLVGPSGSEDDPTWQKEAWLDSGRRVAFLGALHRLDMVAPQSVLALSFKVYSKANELFAVTEGTTDELAALMTDLKVALYDDLVPRAMR